MDYFIDGCKKASFPKLYSLLERARLGFEIDKDTVSGLVRYNARRIPEGSYLQIETYKGYVGIVTSFSDERAQGLVKKIKEIVGGRSLRVYESRNRDMNKEDGEAMVRNIIGEM